MLAKHEVRQQESLFTDMVPGLCETETHLRRLLSQARTVCAEIGLVRPGARLLPQMLADAAVLCQARMRRLLPQAVPGLPGCRLPGAVQGALELESARYAICRDRRASISR
jgi:hypothetical protein